VIDSTDRVLLIEGGVIKREIDVPIERPAGAARRRSPPSSSASCVTSSPTVAISNGATVGPRALPL
jgi:hypothetical protein